MRHPYALYRALAEEPDEGHRGWVTVRGPLLFLLVTSAFVSVTSSGRFIWYHMALAMLGWAFMPMWQIAWVALLGRGNPAGLPPRRQIDLYFRGQAPWYLWMALIMALCLFTPHARLALEALANTGVLPATVLAAFVWSALLTHAFFRSALGYAKGRALGLAVVFYLFYVGGLVAYYAAAGGQIQALFT